MTGSTEAPYARQGSLPVGGGCLMRIRSCGTGRSFYFFSGLAIVSRIDVSAMMFFIL